MNNLLYLAEDHGICPHCGSHTYLNSIYLVRALTGWHLMIEQQCQDCPTLDTSDIPLWQILEQTKRLEEEEPDDDPNDDPGEPIIDELGMISGHRTKRKHEDL